MYPVQWQSRLLVYRDVRQAEKNQQSGGTICQMPDSFLV
jgi:hypothetical protein